MQLACERGYGSPAHTSVSVSVSARMPSSECYTEHQGNGAFVGYSVDIGKLGGKLIQCYLKNAYQCNMLVL